MSIDRLPLPALTTLAHMLVLARVLRRLPGWAWTWYAQHPDAQPSLGRPFALVLAALALALGGCAEPLVHQRALGTLHTRAASTCRATPAQCAALAPCSTELRQGLSAWQAVSLAVAQGGDGAAPLANALIAEGTARVTCLTVGVK